MMKVAKEATPEIPPMLVLTRMEPVPLVDLQGKFVKGLGGLSGKYVKNEYYEGEAPERSVDVELLSVKRRKQSF
jgi:isoleucyl-tRNA synthetase